MVDYSEFDLEEVEIPDDVDPDDVGPALAGKKPIVGEFRRKNGIPVIRDEIGERIRGGV